MELKDLRSWIKQQEERSEEMSLEAISSLRKEKHILEKRAHAQQPIDRKVSSLQKFFDSSVELVRYKSTHCPHIEYPENLPISQKQKEIADLIEKNQVIILAGETGSGKTTQIPKICLSLGRGVRGLIGHTQPRRIAARTVASRIAEELNTELGSVVGYQVRFTDHTDDKSFIKLMTDGILLAEIQQDPMLWKYDTLIIDEAHERSLNIDFLLGYLKQLLNKRPDLKIIVTSATIDLQKFSEHFNDAPIMEVSGRTYPVEVFYRPWQEEYDDQAEAITAAIDEILQLSKGQGGDILVFLSGEREIRETSQAIKKAGFSHLDILPLYARLSLEEQTKVFNSHKGRRVVLATNVAETSITVPGIKYVIDPGTARVSRYGLRTKVQRLPIEPISQASANQRMGRCGRVSNGVCIRLFDKTEFECRPQFTEAEILRTNLAAVILQMLQLRIGDVRKFPFVDSPDNRLINDGFKLLEELHAVDVKGYIQPMGKQLQKLPVDPRLARAVVESSKLNCLSEVLIIVSALSIQDPRERPSDKQQASDEKHRRFFDEHSDFIAYVNLWNYVETQRQELSQNHLRKLCKKEFLNFLRLREWRDLHHQLKLAIKDLNFKLNQESASYDSIHRAILAGFLTNLGCKQEDTKDHQGKTRKNNMYDGTRNRQFQIFPGSSQFKKRPKWLLATNFLETSQLFAHGVAKVDPAWVLTLADHLLKCNYFEPHYDSREGQVKAFVKKTLFGLVIVEKQKVLYGKVDPKVSRDVFIRSGLVEGGYGKSKKKAKGEFFAHNQLLIEEVHELEAKTRRKDILVDEEELVEFYNRKLPEGIVNLAGFEYWRKDVEKKDPKILYFSKDRLMKHSAEDANQSLFPSQLSYGGITFPVSYQFNPGHEDDGVNAQIPIALLHEIQPHYLEWLVPGLLRDKCISLVKSLPKQVRKKIVPVPDYVDKVLPKLKPQNRGLTEALMEELNILADANISELDWDVEALEPLYKMNIQVLDDSGKVIDRDRNLARLKDKYRDQVRQTIQTASHSIEQEGIESWNFGTLASSVQLNRGSIKITGYPALTDGVQDVSLRVLDNPNDAKIVNQRGVARLLAKNLKDTRKYLEKELLKGKDIGLTVVDLGKRADVVDDIIMASIKEICVDEFFNGSISDKEQFDCCLEKIRPEVVSTAFDIEKKVISILRDIVEIKKTIKSSKNALAIALLAGDIHRQLEGLVYRGFLFDTPLRRLGHYPRYLKAIKLRIEKSELNPQKDRIAISSLENHWQRHELRLSQEGESGYFLNESWQEYRWMMEELRVSLFAQSLKTLIPVSDKRLNKQWKESL